MCLLCCLCGCASRQALDWSKIMAEYGDGARTIGGEFAEGNGAGSPDVPAEPLPEQGRLSGLDLPTGLGPGAPVAEQAITIQPDTLLQIGVVEDPELNGQYKVNAIGAIQLGYLGPVILYNMTERDAEEKIKQVLESRDFRNATVSVKIYRASYDKIRVAGAVANPGEIQIGPGDVVSLRNVLMRVGGINMPARYARVKVVRGGLLSPFPASLPGEAYALAKKDGAPYVPDVELTNNDIVYVYSARGSGAGSGRGRTRRPITVLVLGEVGRQGFYRFPAGSQATMMTLIFRMGGLPPYANDKAIRVIRRDEDGFEKEFRVNAREILKEGDPDLDFGLMHGDRVIVPERRISLF